MSVKVDLDKLSGALGDYAFAYLITVDGSYHAHTVAVEPVMVDGVIDVGRIGGRTSKNLTEHDGVTVVWPPREPSGYSLIVDGRGQLTAAGGDRCTIVPSRAVLHRKATADSPAVNSECLNDCVVLSEN